MQAWRRGIVSRIAVSVLAGCAAWTAVAASGEAPGAPLEPGGSDRVARAEQTLDGIDAVINTALADWKTPGVAISIVVDGDTIFSLGYGLCDVEHKLLVTSQTRFAIGSATKAFTAFVLGTLVDEGKLDWDEPVASYLPGFKLYDEYASAHLTTRDMLSHRSGLPRHDLVWYNNDRLTREEIVHRLRYLRPDKELRAEWQYNNLMYAAAGRLIEVLTGESWEENVRERIMEPAGMIGSTFSVDDAELDPEMARPYVDKDGELRKVAFRPVGPMGPAGSINAGSDDMSQWMKLQLGDGSMGGRRLISADTLRELHTPQMVIPGLPDKPEHSPASYTLGWFEETWRGHWRLYHGGNIDGFSALVSLYPADGVGIAVMVNKDNSPLPALLTLTLADRILELEPEDWLGKAAAERDNARELDKQARENKGQFRVRGTKPSRALAEFAGRYEDPGYGPLEIREQDKRLVMLYNGMTLPLEHWHYDVFNVAEKADEIIPENLRVRFLTDDRGRVSGVSVPFEPRTDPIVFRRLPDPELSDPAYLARLAGEYELGDQTLVFVRRGSVLFVELEGQPTYELVPSGPDEFALKGVTGYSVRFTVPDGGDAEEAKLIEPGGVFTAPRK